MTYELKLDLLGGEKVEAILQKLQGLTGALSGGSGFGSGGSSGGSAASRIMTDRDVKNLEKGAHAAKEIARASRDATTNAAQGFSAGGWSKAFSKMKGGFSKSFLELNPDLAARINAPQIGITKGLRDVTGKDLAKVLAMGEFNASGKSFKGLRDVTGADLAKVMALGDINQLNKPPVLKSNSNSVLESFLKQIVGVGVALRLMRLEVKLVSDTLGRASQIYSNALKNGMGLQFSTNRSLLAKIMGVSEQDVFRFGSQMAYLNPKLQQASSILARTATPLTEVSWEWKVLQADLTATAALLADSVSPAMFKFISGLDMIVKACNRLFDNPIVRTIVTSGLSGVAQFVAPLASAWIKGIAGLGGNGGGLPAPQAWMKQLPASSWERMGLVTMGGTQNYAKETAKNTREMANALKELAAASRGKPQNSAFGMSPSTAQP
jgi:hypothetical protein